ncbi:MAG: AraC family transcriptional regulator [Lachnospiraceae bacterium]|nr:AraC family transcriptional regulator [Lachnospiraceae bacterium]
MTKNEQFEKLELKTSINLISPPRYPQSFPLHWHQYAEIIALPGDAQPTQAPVIQINQVRYCLEPGDIVFAWAGELHEIVSNKDHLLLALQFPGSLISGLPEFTPYLNSFRIFHRISAAEMPKLSQRMILHMQQMLEIKNSQRPFAGVEVIMSLYHFFMDFGSAVEERRGISCASVPGCSPQLLDKMNQACDYITENCEQPLTLEDMARQFGFSIFYFSRIFKAATSYNFTEYVTLQRVKRAQSNLAQSNLNITEIAFQSGFKSISSFNRAFRQYKGCSPSEYRKYHSTD